ncbi:MAG: hypothetical protein UY05_C0015G0013 [Candidatus Peregrinibacteria bacterium GW2011_GWA2_47_7]|nr:MAG: hypothetical protein UY05_C0015G0013 [Candidatus Peregrinibacteria bacterium GW2011_GWA2_47_7]
MTLDEQYQKTIDDQRTHLMELQEAFNKKCDEAKVTAQEKLKGVGELDSTGKEAILKDQQATLDAALAELKGEIDHSTRATMRALEAIMRQKEQQILADLEKQLTTL